jgi:hypothetical protein
MQVEYLESLARDGSLSLTVVAERRIGGKKMILVRVAPSFIRHPKL